MNNMLSLNEYLVQHSKDLPPQGNDIVIWKQLIFEHTLAGKNAYSIFIPYKYCDEFIDDINMNIDEDLVDDFIRETQEMSYDKNVMDSVVGFTTVYNNNQYTIMFDSYESVDDMVKDVGKRGRNLHKSNLIAIIQYLKLLAKYKVEVSNLYNPYL